MGGEDAETDHGRRPTVGSVSEEATRLFEELSAWAGSDGGETDGGETEGGETEGGETRVSDTRGDDAGDAPCERCGAAQGVGQASSCRVCPLCQGMALLRLVRPETVDRLADLATAVAESLRVAAAHRRDGAPGRADRPEDGDHPSDHTSGQPGDQTPRHGGERSARAAARHTVPVERIRVTNSDELHHDEPDPARDGTATPHARAITDEGAGA